MRLWSTEISFYMHNKQDYHKSLNRNPCGWYPQTLAYLRRTQMLGTTESQEDTPFSMAPLLPVRSRFHFEHVAIHDF